MTRCFCCFHTGVYPGKIKADIAIDCCRKHFTLIPLDSKISAKVPSTYTPAFFTNNNTSNFSSSSSNYGTSVSNKSPPLKQKLQHKPGFANMFPLKISKTGGLPSFSAQVMFNKLPKKNKINMNLDKTDHTISPRQPTELFCRFFPHLVEVPHLRGFWETVRGEKPTNLGKCCRCNSKHKLEPEILDHSTASPNLGIAGGAHSPRLETIFLPRKRT